MGSVSHRSKFYPEELELIDRVYAVACAYIEARDLYRDPKHDVEEEVALRGLMFVSAGDGPLDFDTLCDNVLASMDKYRFYPEPVTNSQRGRASTESNALPWGQRTGRLTSAGSFRPERVSFRAPDNAAPTRLNPTR